jgi:hypothetical protein
MRMPRVNVYLPEELAAEAKAAGLQVSELTQAAIRAELDRRGRAAALEEFLVELDGRHGPATPDEMAEADRWAESVVAEAGAARRGAKRRARTAS